MREVILKSRKDDLRRTKNEMSNGESCSPVITYYVPSQSTQSASFCKEEMYLPMQMSVLRLNDIMDISNSQSNQKIDAVQSGTIDCNHSKINSMEKKMVLDQQLFDKHYGYRRVDLSLGRKIHWHFKQMLKWKAVDWGQFGANRFPILRWFPAYRWRNNFVDDIIGGIMVSVMSVPQGLAYGYLVGVPPIHGLITGIFGPLIYTIFGTSRHTSPGSFAIVALMVGSVVEQFAESQIHFNPDMNNMTSSICCQAKNAVVSSEEALGVACSITLLIGLWQIFFGILNAGLLAVWLSDHLVQGLTSGAAVHVLTSQLKSMTGVDGVPPTSEPFGLIKFYICFLRRLYNIKTPCAVISSICVFLLLLSNYFIDPILKKWTTVKFPMEFILVIFSSLLVFLGEGTHYSIDVPIVGKVESGLKTPQAPPLNRIGDLIGPAITIAIISFAIHIALAKLVSKKLNYEIDANQEWFALGAMHSISSFFGCFAGGSSLGRTMMQVKFGTKSQFSTVVCSGVLVGFVYGAASFLFYLPKAVLASIVVVAMKDLFIQLVRAFRLYQESIVDFMIFLVTFTAVILINVNFGLISGIAFALLSVVFRSQWAESTCLGRIPGTSDFKGLGHYKSAEEIPGIKVFRFDAPLYFANAELFILRVHKACGLNPILVRAKLMERMESERKLSVNKDMKTKEESEPLNANDMQLRVNGHQISDASAEPLEDGIDHIEMTQLTHIIIDCSSIPYVDIMGKDALAQTYTDYASIDITVMMAHCKVAVRQFFETTDFYQRVPKNRMFVSINDAVTHALEEQRRLFPNVTRSVKMKSTEQKLQQPIAHSPAQKTLPFNSDEKELQSTQMSVQSLSPTQQANNSKEKQIGNNRKKKEGEKKISYAK